MLSTYYVVLVGFLIYHTQTSLQHLLQNKLNMAYFTCDKLTYLFNNYIYGFACIKTGALEIGLMAVCKLVMISIST